MDKMFILETVSRNLGMGTVLSQQYEDGGAPNILDIIQLQETGVWGQYSHNSMMIESTPLHMLAKHSPKQRENTV